LSRVFIFINDKCLSRVFFLGTIYLVFLMLQQ